MNDLSKQPPNPPSENGESTEDTLKQFYAILSENQEEILPALSDILNQALPEQDGQLYVTGVSLLPQADARDEVLGSPLLTTMTEAMGSYMPSELDYVVTSVSFTAGTLNTACWIEIKIDKNNFLVQIQCN